MIYAYRCPEGHCFDVTKRLAEIDREERCPECGAVGERYISTTKGFTTSESLGLKKPPEDFRHFMRVLHNNTPGSKMVVD